MTVRPAPKSQPSIPSHQVSVREDCLLLSDGRRETAILDESVASVQWSEYCTKQDSQGTLGYRQTTLIYGREGCETRIALPWRSGQADPLSAYRERIGEGIADRVERQLAAHRSYRGRHWSIEGDWLTLPNRARVRLSEVADVRFFHQEAAYWTKDDPTPRRLPSNTPDQLVLAELLSRAADRNQLDVATNGDLLGRTLFAVRPNAWATIADFARLRTLLLLPRVVWILPLLLILILFVPEMPGWFFFDALLLFLIALLAANVCWLFESREGLLHWRDLEICERGIRIRRVLDQKLRYRGLIGYCLYADLVFRRNRHRRTVYLLRLAFDDGLGSLFWKELRWCESDVVRGELAFLVDMLHVATNGGLLAELDDDRAPLQTESTPTGAAQI